MTLSDVVDALETAKDDLCVVARRPWRRDSDALLVKLTEDGRVPSHAQEAGFEYFLEISLMKEEVLGAWQSRLTQEQRFDVVLYYAENDAWPTWFHELCQENVSRGA